MTQPPTPSPSWAPPWPPTGPVPRPGPPAGPPPRSRGLVVAATGGLLAGLLASGLVVVALFTASAEDIGEAIADRIGTAVEEGIIEGTRVATEEVLGELDAFEEDLLHPSGVPEQFPPVPPQEAGPDPVLDAYAQDCFTGDLQACEDLLF